MLILFIVDDTHFFIPSWLRGVISQLAAQHQVIGITPLPTSNSHNWHFHLLRNLHHLHPIDLVRLAIISLYYYLINPSISQVAAQKDIPMFPTQSVNDPIYLQTLLKLKPDLIISSCSQVFKKEILSLPKLGCINRHSSMLPKYGGLLPVFRAMLAKDKYIGVSVHHMTTKIDQGKIIFQQQFERKKDDTLFSLYKSSYELSIFVTLMAITILSEKKRQKRIQKIKGSYFSFPSKHDWAKFLSQKNRFV